MGSVPALGSLAKTAFGPAMTAAQKATMDKFKAAVAKQRSARPVT